MLCAEQSYEGRQEEREGERIEGQCLELLHSYLASLLGFIFPWSLEVPL